MELQKTITIAHMVSPYKASEIVGITNKSNANLASFFSSSKNVFGRFILAIEQYFKHTKTIDEVCYFPFDGSYNFFPNGTLAGLEGKINV